jgi:hypothetical protein
LAQRGLSRRNQVQLGAGWCTIKHMIHNKNAISLFWSQYPTVL